MRYVAAYLLASLGGNTSPSAKDIKNILGSVGIEADDERLNKVISELNGKDINDVMNSGLSKLASVPAGGAVVAPAAAAGGAAGAGAAPAAVEEKKVGETSENTRLLVFNTRWNKKEIVFEQRKSRRHKKHTKQLCLNHYWLHYYHFVMVMIVWKDCRCFFIFCSALVFPSVDCPSFHKVQIILFF
uniref:Large ribosomal subunit protein P2 n=1 Tax=Nothobranchius furzeri TaxID=105023 RepID=A0A8C6M3J7_NOTFU